MSERKIRSEGGTAGGGGPEPFDLTVHLGPDAIPWISATSRAGSVHSIPRRASSLPPLPDLLDMVYDYTDAVQFAEPQPDPELAQVLGELVFGDAMVLELFQATRGVAADRGRPLLFRILASPHLAVLPWELLPDPSTTRDSDGYRYLALAADTYLVRLARGRSYPADSTLLAAPLNLLIVLSSPMPQQESEDWMTFDIYEVKRSLLAELAPLEQAGMLRIDVEDRPTLDNLRRRIGAQRRGYHLFHYVGHALPDRLFLEDRAGRGRQVTSSMLLEVLRLCPDLRLAVFAGCETARAAGDPSALDVSTARGSRDLLSLADRLVQEACPAVIGMQAVLPFSTERMFTRFFYQALASGYSVAEALRMGRGAVRGDERLGGDLLDWSVPALFVGSSEPGPLLPRTAEVPEPTLRRRWDLKLGFRQGEDRFIARDLPLRQMVDFMKGLTPERVLVITGAAGVGKTSLVGRALDELGEVIRLEHVAESVTHVLYVHSDRLLPEVAEAAATLRAGGTPDLAALAKLQPDQAVENLARLAAELLRQGGDTARALEESWRIADWWERIVEDLVRHRFVLAVDEIDLLDRVQRGLLENLLSRWLEARCRASAETAKEQLLVDLQRDLSALREGAGRSETERGPAGAVLTGDLLEHLAGLPGRLLGEGRSVLEKLLEEQVVALTLGEEPATASAPPGILPAATGVDSDLVVALLALENVRRSLGEALRVLADRRSARIVITADSTPPRLLNLAPGLVFEMRLAQLTWPETWRWIHRNLPALMGFGEDYLSQLWPRLGVRLERWEELEGRVLRDRSAANLLKLASEIAPGRPAPAGRARAVTGRRGQRALRVAVAGRDLLEPGAVAESLTRLAVEHGIGGRYLLTAEEAGALAILIDEPSPFHEDGTTTLQEIRLWLKGVLARQPDIVLLDYGQEVSAAKIMEAGDPEVYRTLRSLHHLSLLIAAGGHGQDPALVTVPGCYPEVLGVGPLDADGKLRGYAEWHPHLVKPDLFMTDDLSRTALASAIKPNVLAFHERAQTWGSSFSALHAVAAAALVWSILPDLSPRAIWHLMAHEASKPVAGLEPARSLTVGDAVALARRRAVERTLSAGPASFQTLAAVTGIEVRALSSTLRALMDEQAVVRLTAGRLERFQLCA